MQINLANLLKRYWTMILLTGVIAALVALAVSFVLSPVYESTVRVMVMPREDAAVSGVMVNPKTMYATTQRDMINTPDVLGSTVASLSLDASSTVRVGPIRGILRTAKGFVGAALAFMKYGYVRGEPPFSAAVSQLERNVSTRVLEDSNVIEIEVAWDDPRTAAKIAGAVARQFQIASRERSTEEYNRQLEDILAQIDEKQAALASSSKDLAEFRAKYNVSGADLPLGQVGLSPQTQADLLVAEKKVASAESDLTYWNDLYETMAAKAVTKDDQIRILGAATVPVYPASPNHLLYASVGLLVGLLFGLGVALVLDSKNRVVYTTDDIRNLLDAPVSTIDAEPSRTGGPRS